MPFRTSLEALKQDNKLGFLPLKVKVIEDSFRLTGTIKVEEKKFQFPRFGHADS